MWYMKIRIVLSAATAALSLLAARADGIDFQKLIDAAAAKDGGHGMVFKGVDGKLRITFHQPNSSPNERMRIFELDDDGVRLSVKGAAK